MRHPLSVGFALWMAADRILDAAVRLFTETRRCTAHLDTAHLDGMADPAERLIEGTLLVAPVMTRRSRHADHCRDIAMLSLSSAVTRWSWPPAPMSIFTQSMRPVKALPCGP